MKGGLSWDLFRKCLTWGCSFLLTGRRDSRRGITGPTRALATRQGAAISVWRGGCRSPALPPDTGLTGDPCEGRPRLPPPDEEVDGGVHGAVDGRQEDADVIESLVSHFPHQETDDAEGHATQKEGQAGEQNAQPQLSGRVQLGALLDPQEQQQAGCAHDGQEEQDPHVGDGDNRRAETGCLEGRLRAGVASQDGHQKGQEPEEDAHDG